MVDGVPPPVVDPDELSLLDLSLDAVEEPSTSPVVVMLAWGLEFVSRGIRLYKVPAVPKKPIANAAAP